MGVRPSSIARYGKQFAQPTRVRHAGTNLSQHKAAGQLVIKPNEFLVAFNQWFRRAQGGPHTL